ncbi:DUF5994 family protein [Streptomyces mutabilis]|nr:DUF5994 family protein [Streptomyces mutabilis]GGQ35430.1 hypothetical protein GCM10010279_50370 [Streptomyces mutabilis]
MTVTISRPTTSEEQAAPSRPRLDPAPAGSVPALLDGAWRPRSPDLLAELPAPAAVLAQWGRITRITKNPAPWPVTEGDRTAQAAWVCGGNPEPTAPAVRAPGRTVGAVPADRSTRVSEPLTSSCP